MAMAQRTREKVRFGNGGGEIAAWLYRGTNRACVVMAGGFAVPKEPATDRFAGPFHRAGFSVVAFDYRRLGESGGRPRLVLPVRDQIADWHAAIDLASSLREVDPKRIGLWGFSASGGHVLRVAKKNPKVAAVVAQTPNTNGLAAAMNQSRHQHLGAMARFNSHAILDAAGAVLGRPPRLVPLTGQPGTEAVLTTPDAQDAVQALDPDGQYPQWEQKVAARSALRLAWYSPGRAARRVGCPLLVVVCDHDQSALAGPAVRAARSAPNAELVRVPGGHYAPFMAAFEQTIDAELDFLRRHLAAAGAPQTTASVSAL